MTCFSVHYLNAFLIAFALVGNAADPWVNPSANFRSVEPARQVNPARYGSYHIDRYSPISPQRGEDEVLTHLLLAANRPKPGYDHMGQILFNHARNQLYQQHMNQRSAFSLMYPEFLLRAMNIQRSNGDPYDRTGVPQWAASGYPMLGYYQYSPR